MQLEAISHREFEVVVKDGLRSPVNTTYGAHLEERPWGVAPVEKKRPAPPIEVGAGLFLNK
jgi:hypothetical protein